MRYETSSANLPKVGEKVWLIVNLREGVVGFKPEFVFSDGVLREEYRKEHGEDEIYHFGHYLYSDDGYDDYDFDPPARFRSVRIFKPVCGERAVLCEGERWHGRVADWKVSYRKSKDGRAIIYVGVSDLQRNYSWSRERRGDNLALSLKCGERQLRRRVLPLKERLYRFRVKGDSTRITEIKALGTEQRPVALAELPKGTTFRELVEAEVAGFGKLRSPAVRRIASAEISKTLITVDRKTLEGYKNLPFGGRGADLTSVRGRRAAQR